MFHQFPLEPLFVKANLEVDNEEIGLYFIYQPSGITAPIQTSCSTFAETYGSFFWLSNSQLMFSIFYLFIYFQEEEMKYLLDSQLFQSIVMLYFKMVLLLINIGFRYFFFFFFFFFYTYIKIKLPYFLIQVTNGGEGEITSPVSYPPPDQNCISFILFNPFKFLVNLNQSHSLRLHFCPNLSLLWSGGYNIFKTDWIW